MSSPNQLQNLQQNLQNILIQKQQMEAQMMELDSALIELKDTPQAYKIVGKLMIASSKDDLKKDLEEKKEVLTIRITSMEKQEKNLQENFEKTQKEVMQSMKKDSN
jgi:prefoldin beta subunit